MITAKELKEIADRQNNKSEIELIEDGIMNEAKRGNYHYARIITTNKAEIRKIADYFKKRGFEALYMMYGLDSYTDMKVYTFSINWSKGDICNE